MSAQSAQSARAISTQSILIHASAAEHAQAFAHRVQSSRSKIDSSPLRPQPEAAFSFIFAIRYILLTTDNIARKFMVRTGSFRTDYQWALNIAFKRTSLSTSATGSLPSVGRFLYL